VDGTGRERNETGEPTKERKNERVVVHVTYVDRTKDMRRANKDRLDSLGRVDSGGLVGRLANWWIDCYVIDKSVHYVTQCDPYE